MPVMPLFAGLMPLEIQQLFPNLWVSDEDEEGKNLNEEEFLKIQMNRVGKGFKHSYNKINNQKAAKRFADNFSNLKQIDLNVAVFNFVDMLSHARTETEVVKELVSDESVVSINNIVVVSTFVASRYFKRMCTNWISK